MNFSMYNYSLMNFYKSESTFSSIFSENQKIIKTNFIIIYIILPFTNLPLIPFFI